MGHTLCTDELAQHMVHIIGTLEYTVYKNSKWFSILANYLNMVFFEVSDPRLGAGQDKPLYWTYWSL